MPTHERPCVVQGDRTVLLEVDHPAYERARDTLARFAELEKSPEHVHTYRLSALALWNAAAGGVTADQVVAALRELGRYELPGHVEHEIREIMRRHGRCGLEDVPGDAARLRLIVCDPPLRERLLRDAKLGARLTPDGDGFLVAAQDRGPVKQALLKIGYPVDDRAGLKPGAPHPIALALDAFTPYAYQTAAARAFMAAGGHGVIVLPCGAGKTVVSLCVMAELGTRTLVLTTGREAATQWRRELAAKTTLSPGDVALYASDDKATGPVTIATYSIVSRKGGGGPTGFVHFDRLAEEPWGLIVYDEVHLLPAPVFRLTAELQARRRLGLTATLVREDGREGDVFALIGPKRYEVPWRELEASGHIAQAKCFEVRVRLPDEMAPAYAAAPPREQVRLAAENPLKLRALRALADRHEGDRILVMGTYLEPLAAAARLIGAPLLTGDTPHRERELAYERFRRGENRTLVLSRVGNFAIDLPEANVLVQISGTMGSRQEEAQRLGRVLRPKPGGATFYTIVTRDTVEQEQALHRQLFLTEQGYRYFIEDFVPPFGSEEQADGPTLH